MVLLRIVPLVLAAALAAPVAAQYKGTNNMEILRKKLKADKKLVVVLNIGPTKAEGQLFWPIYDAYQHDLEQINEGPVDGVCGTALLLLKRKGS